MDFATKWPEAIPLKVADSESVARALIKVFAGLGIPEELLTNNGSNFTEGKLLLDDWNQVHKD